jgi:LPS sulfotransferase NodH
MKMHGGGQSTGSRPDTDAPASLIYITGSMRSGSTLLSAILGGLPDVHNAGELRTFWKQMDGSDWLCGCGEPMTSCEFWADVVSASGVTVPEAADVSRRYQASRLRIRRLSSLTSPDSSDPLDDDYRQIMEGLLRGLRKVSGKRVILDDSKAAPDALFFQRFSSESLRAIHVVRDPRAVAFSRGKRKFHHLKDGASRPMVHSGLSRSSLFWMQMNLGADRVAKVLTCSTRVRYEDFCADPALTVAALADFVGLEMPADLVDGDGNFERRREHTVGGNPDRWTTGREQVRVDDKWRRELPRAAAAEVTALTVPLLLRYGYPLRVRKSAS